MGDFTNVVKYLDLIKSRQATIDEAVNSPQPFEKYYRLRKSRDIKKIRTRLIIDPWTYTDGDQRYSGEMLAQWNVNVSHSFYILTPYQSNQNINGGLTVKWVTDDLQVFRYLIYGNQRLLIHEHNPPFWEDLHVFPTYEAILIPKNFCFEFWHCEELGPVANPGLPDGLTLNLSILTNPSYPDQLSIDIHVNNPLLIADLATEAIDNSATVLTDEDNNILLDSDGNKLVPSL